MSASGTTCAICLEDAKNPVAIPCGHLHCEKCLIQCIDACDNAVECPCPTCRAPFMIATPDLRFVPPKYHPFIQSSVRRVYPSTSDIVQALEQRNEKLRADNGLLKDKLKSLKRTNEHLERDKKKLMDTCESNQAAVGNYREKERALRDELYFLNDEKEAYEQEAADLSQKYNELKDKYKELKKIVKQSKLSTVSSSSHATKRSSTQAALDQSPGGEASPSNISNDRRLILPVPKRPRLATGWKPIFQPGTNGMDVDNDDNSDRLRNDAWTIKPLPKHHHLSNLNPDSVSAGTNASTSGNKRKPLQTGITIYLDGLDVSVDVDQDIEDDEEKDGPSKIRHHYSTGSSSSSSPVFASSSRSQAPTPPQIPVGRPASKSMRPTQAKAHAPLSPWDVFNSEEGSHGTLDFTLGSSSPAHPDNLVLTDEEDTQERENKGKGRAYVFRGRRVQRIDE